MGRRGRSDEGCRGEGYGEHYLDLMAPRRRSRRALTGGGEKSTAVRSPQRRVEISKRAPVTADTDGPT